MEITIQATGNELLNVILAVGIFLVLVGVIIAVVTNFDLGLLHVVVAFVLLGIVGVLFGSLTQSQADTRAEENFALVAAEQFNIENPTPLEDDEKMGACHAGGGKAVSEYSWINEDGDIVKGLIMRSAEQNGECVFTLRATD